MNPEWLTKAVYAIIDDTKLIDNFGRFNLFDLERIWGSKYNSEERKALIELMIRFELCFYIEDTQEYVIPLLLAPEEPTIEWRSEESLCIEYNYEFLPEGILTKFIVRNQDKLKDGSKII